VEKMHKRTTSHWLFGRLDGQKLGGSNVILGCGSCGRKSLGQYIFTSNIKPLSGIGSRADEALNSGHIANSFTLCTTLSNTTLTLNLTDTK